MVPNIAVAYGTRHLLVPRIDVALGTDFFQEDKYSCLAVIITYTRTTSLGDKKKYHSRCNYLKKTCVKKNQKCIPLGCVQDWTIWHYIHTCINKISSTKQGRLRPRTRNFFPLDLVRESGRCKRMFCSQKKYIYIYMFCANQFVVFSSFRKTRHMFVEDMNRHVSRIFVGHWTTTTELPKTSKTAKYTWPTHTN